MTARSRRVIIISLGCLAGVGLWVSRETAPAMRAERAVSGSAAQVDALVAEFGVDHLFGPAGRWEHDSQTLLMIACRTDEAEIVKHLIGRGADVGLRSRLLRNALDIAARHRSLRVIPLLCRAGLDPCEPAGGIDPPILGAVRAGLWDQVRLMAPVANRDCLAQVLSEARNRSGPDEVLRELEDLVRRAVK